MNTISRSFIIKNLEEKFINFFEMNETDSFFLAILWTLVQISKRAKLPSYKHCKATQMSTNSLMMIIVHSRDLSLCIFELYVAPVD